MKNIKSDVAVKVLQVKTQMLPYIGAPNRTALDQQRLNELTPLLP